MSSVDVLFYVFSLVAVGGGVAVILSRNTVHAAMFMISSLLGVACLFALLEAFFLAVLQVLVYAGAIMVLFLFIIMLLDVGPDAGKGSKWSVKSLAFGIASLLGIGLLTVLMLGFVDSPNAASLGWNPVGNEAVAKGEQVLFSKSVKSFGFGLLTKYMLPLQVAGFLLLAAMVGVIVLSKKRSDEDEEDELRVAVESKVEES